MTTPHTPSQPGINEPLPSEVKAAEEIACLCSLNRRKRRALPTPEQIAAIIARHRAQEGKREWAVEILQTAGHWDRLAWQAKDSAVIDAEEYRRRGLTVRIIERTIIERVLEDK